jgi:hypothetical protein
MPQRQAHPCNQAPRRHLIAELVPIRLYWPDFDQIAKQHGLEALREYCALNVLDADDGLLTRLITVCLLG